MKIIPPLPVTQARLTSTTVAEPDAAMGEIAWTASTAYAVGTIRIRTTTHRKYLALTNIANTVTTPPENDPTNWKDIGPTNRYAMFDAERNTATSVQDLSLQVVVTPGVRTQAICAFGVTAEAVRVSATSDGVTVYDRNISLSTRNLANWSDFFFNEFGFRPTLNLLDLPVISNLVITITFSRSVLGTLAVETLTFGRPVDVGEAQYGATSDILDFSRIERDQFGAATLIKRKTVPTLSAQVYAHKTQVPAIKALREQYRATPLVFVAVDDSTDPYADPLSMIGIFKRLPIIVEYPNHVLINLEAEGL